MNYDDEDSGEYEAAREPVPDLRERVRARVLGVVTLAGRFVRHVRAFVPGREGGALPADYHGDTCTYHIDVTYRETGARLVIDGTCSLTRSRRLTAFAAVHEMPAYAVCLRDAKACFSSGELPRGLGSPELAAGIGVFEGSVVQFDPPGPTLSHGMNLRTGAP